MTSTEDLLWEHLRSRGLGPGDRLPPERELAADLALSRPTVRIALGVLAGRGLVETRNRSGTYISGTNPDDLLDVRLLLEPYAAHRAARTARPSDHRALQELLGAASAALDDGPAFAAADLRIHEAVGTLSGNVLVAEIMAGLRTRLARSRDNTSPNLGVRRSTLEDLRALVDAITDGDGAGAEAAMRTHLLTVGAAADRLKRDEGRKPR
ncbi:FadR/GntR family transcriptional regulator [Nocardioides endophyticus]|uniref:FadR/GntR family transcriptional regulator n=1 Tax=Nocardioides endophyticus TaxID=1353775 RepID=A0ABP8Z9P9_9ACTN